MHSNRPARFLFVFGILALTTATSQAADRYVPDQHPTISQALNASQAGDRVLVRPGTYPEFGLALKAGVTIEGLGASPEEVVIDGSDQGRVLRAINLTSAAAVINLTVRGGHAFGTSYVEGSGGAILVRNCGITLTGVHFVGNRATASGGAVRALTAHPVIRDCEFRDNHASQGGGAIDASYESTLDVTNTRFRGNQSSWGGASSVRNSSVADFDHADFVSNTAVQYPALGGGVYSDHSAQVSLRFCTFVANSALYGGAVSIDREAQVTITNCTMRMNLAAYVGGGLYVKAASPQVDHTILASNTGRAVQCVLPGRVATFTTCDIWGNSGGNWDGQVENQRLERQNFQANPLFCGDNDHQIAANSPCAVGANGNGLGLVGALSVGCANQDDGGVDTDPDPLPPGDPLTIAPNPFNPRTTITFEVPAPGLVRVRIHDLRGAVVATVLEEVLPRGRHSVPWKGLDDLGRIVASGTYLVSFQSPAGLVTKKILVAR
jgi:hypothetical protein